MNKKQAFTLLRELDVYLATYSGEISVQRKAALLDAVNAVASDTDLKPAELAFLGEESLERLGLVARDVNDGTPLPQSDCNNTRVYRGLWRCGMRATSKDIGRAVLDLLGIDIAGVTGFDLHIDIHDAPRITLRTIIKTAPNEGSKMERKYELMEVADPKMTPPVNPELYESTDLGTANHWIVHQTITTRPEESK